MSIRRRSLDIPVVVVHSHGILQSFPQVPTNCRLCWASQPCFICGKTRHSEYVCDAAWIRLVLTVLHWATAAVVAWIIHNWFIFVQFFEQKNKATVHYCLELTSYKPHYYWTRSECLHQLVDFKFHLCLHQCNKQYHQGQGHPGSGCWFLYLYLLLHWQV